MKEKITREIDERLNQEADIDMPYKESNNKNKTKSEDTPVGDSVRVELPNGLNLEIISSSMKADSICNLILSLKERLENKGTNKKDISYTG